MKVEFLVLPNGKSPIEEFFEQLDNKTVAKIYRYIEMLERDGTERELEKALGYLHQAGVKI